MTALTEILLNKWFLSFVVGWIVFFLLVDWKKLKINIWGGIAAVILELLHDVESVAWDFYYFHDMGIKLINVSFFFTFGVIFTMGIIFLQFMPQNPKLKIIHIITFVIGFLAFELIAIRFGMLEYFYFTFWISVFDDLVVISTLTWTKSLVLFVHDILERKSEKC